jgi:DNA-binding NarL/FixJ family response regulator
MAPGDTHVAVRRLHPSAADPRRAVCWLAAADALRQAIGAPLPPADRPGHEATVRAARAAVGEVAFAAAWAEGQAMSVEQAVAAALAGEEAAPPGRVPTGGPEQLTAREAEVAGLVARGLSNRQIAAKLSISERTVSTHLTNIMGKLGVTGRVQVATWAVAQGLGAATC